MRKKIRTQAIRIHLQRWIGVERVKYADAQKYGDGLAGRDLLVEAMKNEGYGDTWHDFICNYLDRARQMGVNTPQGRQALAKAVVTAMHCCETAIQVYGPLPNPGVSSGTIEPWNEYPIGHFPFERRHYVATDWGTKQPEIMVTPAGQIAVEGGNISHVSPADEDDDTYGLEA